MNNDYCKASFIVGVGGQPTGIGAYFRTLDAAKRPASITAYDDYGVVKELLELRRASGVPHICIFRPAVYPNNPDYNQKPEDAANRYFERWFAALPPELLADAFAREHVWLIFANEGRKELEWADWWGHFAWHMATLAMGHNLRTLAWGWSAGTPDERSATTDGWHRFLKLADAHPNRVGIAVHEGANPAEFHAPAGEIPLINNVPWITRRYKWIFDACEQYGLKRPRIAITECAWRFDSAAPLAKGLPQVAQAAQFYAQDPEVLTFALWGFVSGHQGVAKTLQPYVEPITNMATSAQWSGVPIWADGAPHYQGEIEPPPPPPPPPTKPEHPTEVPTNIGTFDPYNWAIPKAIYAAGERPASEEWQDNGHHYQQAATADGSTRIYAVKNGDWGNVFVVGEEAKPPPPPPPAGEWPTGNWGVEVSHNQDPERIDWQMLKDAGMKHLGIRGGYGTTHDRARDRFYELGREYGFLLYPWWYLDKRFSGAASGREFADFVNGYAWDLEAYFDVEANTYNGQDITPSKRQVLNAYEAFVERCDWPTGNYTGRYAWDSIMAGYDPANSGVGRALWFADWEAPDGVMRPEKLPAPFTMDDVRFIQESARVLPAYASQLDVNYRIEPKKQPGTDIWAMLTSGVGRAYMVKNYGPDGTHLGTERYQNFLDADNPNILYITKNENWEAWILDGDEVRLWLDTSPARYNGIDAYYRVIGADGRDGGRKCKRFMAIGEDYMEPIAHAVTFYRRESGVDYGDPRSGTRRNIAKLVVADSRFAFIDWGASEIDLIERGFGRVGWQSDWGWAELVDDDPGGYVNRPKTITLPNGERFTPNFYHAS